MSSKSQSMNSITNRNEKSTQKGTIATPPEGAAGTLPEEIYDGTLNFWRSGIRRQIIKYLKEESEFLAKTQRNVRHPWLDRFFVYTSSLGTHTFFLTALPIFFFFGLPEIGRAIIAVLALGVYASSFLKDLFCVPRPYSPPLTRLSLGTHHLEYGFPSTHSTNSFSAALWFLLLLLSSPEDSWFRTPWVFISSCLVLFLYTASIVLGRLYCGMHSIADITSGSVIGIIVTLFWWYCGPILDNWLLKNAQEWTAPLYIAAVCTLSINQFPQSIDDCPCFEDATAFSSVLAGSEFGLWFARRYGLDAHAGFFTTTHDLPIHFTALLALSKIVLGVAAVLLTRMTLKRLLQRVLPPLFRFLALMVRLPRRRWYTPATEYSSVPLDKERPGARGIYGGGMGRAMPSVMDLPSTLQHDAEVRGNGHTFDLKREAMEGLKRRKVEGSENGNGFHADKADFSIEATEDEEIAEDEYKSDIKVVDDSDEVRHYDADVLTRAIVYFAIGLVVTEVIPIGLEVLGFGM